METGDLDLEMQSQGAVASRTRYPATSLFFCLLARTTR
jgi:hypothetical protein